MLDILEGLEAAVLHKWFDYSMWDAERRRSVSMAYDTVPIFSVEIAEGHGLVVDFWVAADPVTTVQKPEVRDVPTQEMTHKLSIPVKAAPVAASLRGARTMMPGHAKIARAAVP